MSPSPPTVGRGASGVYEDDPADSRFSSAQGKLMIVVCVDN